MSARKPTPYSSFSAYNKFEVEQKQQQDEVHKRQQQMSQHVSKNAPMSQANTQMNQHMSQQQQVQMQQQQQQGQQQGQSRFKEISTSENLYSILTSGLTQFQNNFKAKNNNIHLYFIYNNQIISCKHLSKKFNIVPS